MVLVVTCCTTLISRMYLVLRALNTRKQKRLTEEEEEENEVKKEHTQHDTSCCWHIKIEVRSLLFCDIFFLPLSLCLSFTHFHTNVLASFVSVLCQAAIYTINKFIIVVVVVIVDTPLTTSVNDKFFFRMFVWHRPGKQPMFLCTSVHACVRIFAFVLVENILLTNGKKKKKIDSNRMEWNWNRSHIAIEQIKIYIQF